MIATMNIFIMINNDKQMNNNMVKHNKDEMCPCDMDAPAKHLTGRSESCLVYTDCHTKPH